MVYERREHHEPQWAAIVSVAQKIGCTAQTLRSWIAKAERKAGADDPSSAPRLKELLKLASAFFAQAEFDRRLK
jgi:transposase-like protein